MTTTQHVQELVDNYHHVSGLMAAAVVALTTSDNDEQCETHARSVAQLAEGANAAMDDLRRYVSDPKVLGRDNFYEFLEKPEL